MHATCGSSSSAAGGPGQVRLPLKHLLSALLASAAERGFERIKIANFFSILAELLRREDYRSVAPPLTFRQTGEAYYSKRIDEALQSLIGYLADIPNPTMQCLLIDKSLAERQLQWLRETYPEQPWLPLAQAFVSELESLSGRSI